MFMMPHNNFNEIPTCPIMSRKYPLCPMNMQPDEMQLDETREVQTPGTTGGPDFVMEPGSPVEKNASYTQGWLKTQIGKYIKVEFLIGANMLIDREGVLEEVGISYIVIRESGTQDMLMCDIYSIKFVRIFNNQEKIKLCK